MQTAALKNLGLNIRRAKIKKTADDKLVVNKFYITDAHSSEKILRSSRLEEIRATIFSNLLYYHPEAEGGVGWGHKAKKPAPADPLKPLGPRKRSAADAPALQAVLHTQRWTSIVVADANLTTLMLCKAALRLPSSMAICNRVCKVNFM